MDSSTNNCESLNAYKLCKESGTLDFWDEPEEDIYTFEDGEPIDG